LSYVRHVLQPGETIRYQGSVNWLTLYLPAIILAVIGAAALALTSGWIIAAVCFFAALMFALRAWIIRRMTEFVVTDRRVIYRRGIVSRNTVEVNMDKIESVDVNQTLLGRIFDYGDVTIKGTGSTLEPLLRVDRPIAFRNEIIAR
jgi:uncharacterized membrane protein YdbT with pleckstrin-like domain